MIKTNRLDYKKDLEEVIYSFCNGENLEILHEESNDGENFLDVFKMDNQEYVFKNQKKCKDNLELLRYEKRFSKLGLYRILSKKFGYNNEWGALTGIRPIKMAFSLNEDFEKEFKEVFLVSDKKIEVVKNILKIQKPLLDYKGEYCDFFISVPFCPSRCSYCSFISQEIKKCSSVSNYVDALVKEIEDAVLYSKNCRSVYIGGGTPVCLELGDLEKILKSVSPIINNGVEFTVEAGRPDEITKEKLELLKKYKVNRICVNPQTFSNETLKLIGRKHTAESIIEKYELVKKYDFIVNMDLIAGLFNESFEDFKNSLDKVISLNPENITVHTLCLKRGATIRDKFKRLEVSEISKMIDYSYEILSKNGYFPYYLYRQKYSAENLENVGFSKQGTECIYNIDVMEEYSNNVACGANAVSKRVFLDENRLERLGSPKDISTYISKIDKIIESKRKLFS